MDPGPPAPVPARRRQATPSRPRCRNGQASQGCVPTAAGPAPLPDGAHGGRQEDADGGRQNANQGLRGGDRQRIPPLEGKPTTHFTISDDGRRVLAAGSERKTFGLWDVETGRLLTILRFPEEIDGN